MRNSIIALSLRMTLFTIGGCALFEPSPTVKNPECESSAGAIHIQQILDGGVLATLCSYMDKGYCMNGDPRTYYFIEATGQGFVDDMVVSLGDKCLVGNGTYSYTNALGAKKTVRKLKMIEGYTVNPAYAKMIDEKVKKIQQEQRAKELAEGEYTEAELNEFDTAWDNLKKCERTTSHEKCFCEARAKSRKIRNFQSDKDWNKICKQN